MAREELGLNLVFDAWILKCSWRLKRLGAVCMSDLNEPLTQQRVDRFLEITTVVWAVALRGLMDNPGV